MDNKSIFLLVGQLEERVNHLQLDITKLKEQLVSIIEENHLLRTENKNIRNRLEEEYDVQTVKENEEPTSGKRVIGEGYDNLARLYQEGFHVCNTHYGSIRSDGEDCLFCLSFLHQK